MNDVKKKLQTMDERLKYLESIVISPVLALVDDKQLTSSLAGDPVIKHKGKVNEPVRFTDLYAFTPFLEKIHKEDSEYNFKSFCSWVIYALLSEQRSTHETSRNVSFDDNEKITKHLMMLTALNNEITIEHIYKNVEGANLRVFPNLYLLVSPNGPLCKCPPKLIDLVPLINGIISPPVEHEQLAKDILISAFEFYDLKASINVPEPQTTVQKNQAIVKALRELLIRDRSPLIRKL